MKLAGRDRGHNRRNVTSFTSRGVSSPTGVDHFVMRAWRRKSTKKLRKNFGIFLIVVATMRHVSFNMHPWPYVKFM
jgi:hypothetical protein